MNRKQFIGQTGKAGILIACSCAFGCKYDVLQDNPIDFTIDLNDSNYQSLLAQGGFVYAHEILIAHTINGEYIATAARCTHEDSLLAYYPSNIIYCGKHGSSFNTKGQVLQGPAITALKTYHTALNGSVLRVYS